MKLKQIEFVNFGPFYQTQTLVVDTQAGRPLVLIRALNDVVKTSFLNAFKFCLYGTEADPVGLGPATGLEMQKSINRKAALDGDGETSVLFSLEHDGDIYEVKRTAHFKKVAEHGDRPEITKWSNTIKRNGNMIIDPSNNLGTNNDFDDMIETWIPKDVSPFFFFDGERIKQYASQKPSPSIIDSIEKILNIKQNLNLQTDLEKARRALSKEVLDMQSQDNETKEEAKRLQELKDKLDKEKQDLDVTFSQLKNTKKRISDLEDWLEEQEGTKTDWEEYNKLRSKQNDNNDAMQSLTGRQKNFHDKRLLSEIIQTAMNITSQTSSRYASYEVKAAKKNIEENLNNCSICDATITEGSRKHLHNVSGQATTNKDSAIQDILDQISAPGILTQERFTILQEKGKIDGEIYSTDSALKTVGDKLSSSASTSAEEEIRNKQSAYDQAKGRLGPLQNQYDVGQDNLLEEFRNYSNEVRLNSEKSTNEKVIIAQARVNLCQQSLDGITEIVEEKVKTEKANIVESMTDTFRKITNAPDLYTSLDLDDKYRILIKLMNHNLKPAWEIGPSSGQSAMIAFSFIASLNRRALTTAPIVIDSPTGKLDPIHRNNIIKFWPEFGEQVFILYQPDELNETQFKGIQDYVSHHYRGIRKPKDPDESAIIDWDGDWEL